MFFDINLLIYDKFILLFISSYVRILERPARYHWPEKGKIMTQSEISKWLKAVTLLMAAMGMAFFFVVVPILAVISRRRYPELAFLFYPGLAYNLAIAIPCYAILYHFWQVCRQIRLDNSFSRENANAFTAISRLAFFLMIEWFIGLLFLAVGGWMKTGALVILIFGIFLSMIVTVIAAALSHLILKAYELRQENELTI